MSEKHQAAGTAEQTEFLMCHQQEEDAPARYSPERHHTDRAAFVRRVRAALNGGGSLIPAVFGDANGADFGSGGRCDAIDDWIEDARNGRR